MIDQSVDIAGLKMKNPVIAASGTFGFGREYTEFVLPNKLGGISVKGLTLKPRKGNAAPRIAETSSGILNSVGLENPGVDAFINKELPWLERFDTAIIANIAGNTLEEYAELAEKLDQCEKLSAIEVNLSCPNVKEGCVAFGVSPSGVESVTKAVRKKTNKHVMVKLTPNVTDIKEIAKAAESAGADSVSLINTLLGMAVDIHTRRPVLANNTGGLSGACVKPVAVRMVWEVYNTVKIPVIGMGGITSGEDAVEFLLAGASAVMVGTANFVDPYACEKVIEGVKSYLTRYGYNSVNDIVGKLELW